MGSGGIAAQGAEASLRQCWCGSAATPPCAYAAAFPTKDAARYTVLVLTMQALVKRQLLIKTRAWGSTLAELCSPVLLICMLVVAYHLVHPDHHEARVRADAYAVQCAHRPAIEAVKSCLTAAAGVCRRHCGTATQHNTGRPADQNSIRRAAVRRISAKQGRRRRRE